MPRFIRYWLPVLAWCTIIFVQSAFATPEIVPRWPYFDKILHVGAYAILGILICRAFNTMAGWLGQSRKLIFIATLLTTLYGFSDEWHQSFVAERTSDFADAVADLVGGLAGSWLYLTCLKVMGSRPEAAKRKQAGQ